MKLLQFEN